MAHDATMDSRVYSWPIDMKKYEEAEKNPDQSKLGLEVSVGPRSKKRRVFKKPPAIVEGDAYCIEFVLHDRGEKSFPGGQIMLETRYASGQSLATQVLVPPISIGDKTNPYSINTIAVSAGMAEIHAVGYTHEGQRIFLYDNGGDRFKWSGKIYHFMIWPIASIYNSWTILLAGIAVALSILSLSLSIFSL